MNDLIINVEKSTRMVLMTKTTVGNDMENLQEKIIFKFTDTFVDGQARLEYKIGSTKNYIELTKENNTYILPIQNVLTKEGKIEMQLVITESTEEEHIPVFKSNVFYLYCNRSLNAVNEAPEGYDLWIEQANAKLNAMDEALTEVDNLDIDATKTGNTATVSITNKEGITKSVEIIDGENGQDGYSPTAIVSKSGNTSTITITDKNGTTTASVNDGINGIDGIDGKDAKINGVNTLSIEAGTNISIDQQGNTLTINSTETDPTVPSYVKSITQTNITSWNNKAEISDIPDASEYIFVSPSNDTTYNTDTQIIQNAINQANTDGKAVFFRNGTYYIQGPITIYNGTILLGNKNKNEIRTKSDNSVFIVSSGTSISSLHFEGLKFLNQNSVDSTQKTQSGTLIFLECRGIYVENCDISNYEQVFKSIEVNSFISHSKFKTIYGRFANLASDSVISDNYFNGSRYSIFKNSTVLTNISSTSFSNNFVDYFSTVFGSYYSNSNTHSSIVGNTFDRCLCVFHDNIQRLAITGNSFSNFLYESARWSNWNNIYVKPNATNINIYDICSSSDSGALLATTLLENQIWSIFKFDDKTADTSDYTLKNHVFSDVVFTGNIGEKINYYFYISESLISGSTKGISTNNCKFDNNTILKGTGGTAYTESDSSVILSGEVEDTDLSDYEVHFRGATGYGSLVNTYFDFMDMKKFDKLSDLPSANLNVNNAKTFPFMKAIVINDGNNNGIWLNNQGVWEKINNKENKGKITINNTEKTPTSHTLSWTENGVTYSYEVVTV